MRDQSDYIQVLPLFPPAAGKTDNSVWTSNIIPVAGFDSMTLVLVTGALSSTSASFSVLMEDGNDPALADHAPVDPSLLIGSVAQAGFTSSGDANETKKIGYVGYKGFVRMTVTPASNNAAAYLAGIAILGRPRNMPTPNPPL